MKYGPIFITATNTNIGKTYATLKLIDSLGKKGLHVGVLKPIETGVVKYPLDGKLLLDAAKKTNPDLKEFTCRDIVPYQYSLPAAPYVSKGKQKIDLKALHVTYRKIADVSDIVLIEGAGGLMVPIEKDFYMYDLAKEFKAKILLVTHSNLGCINDTLLNLKLLDSLHVEYEWCVNMRNMENFALTTLPYYNDRFGRILTLQNDLEEIIDKFLITDRYM